MGLIRNIDDGTTMAAARLEDGRIQIYRQLKSGDKGFGFILEPENILPLVKELLQARAEHLDHLSLKPDTQAPAGD